MVQSLDILPKVVKVQSQCVRVTLFGDLVCVDRMFSSSGLNLAYEGLLLGMWSGAHEGIPHGATPHASDLRQ
jgi:hypothetical protein